VGAWWGWLLPRLLLASEKPVKQTHESLLLLGLQRAYSGTLPFEVFAEYTASVYNKGGSVLLRFVSKQQRAELFAEWGKGDTSVS
jgi:hypothetical protein